jgi:hypothetical protein
MQEKRDKGSKKEKDAKAGRVRSTKWKKKTERKRKKNCCNS